MTVVGRLETRGMEVGTLVVRDGSGCIVATDRAYEPHVVGVIWGDGSTDDSHLFDLESLPGTAIARTGRVLCRVDASYGAVVEGDLLTSSPTGGHAMRVSDHERAEGAVLGEALGPLDHGRGLVPVMIDTVGLGRMGSSRTI